MKTIPMQGTNKLLGRRCCLLAVILIGTGVPALAWGQAAVPPGFHAYRLEHAQLDDASRQLKAWLQEGNLEGEVILDRQQNRVLLRGSESVQRLAGQLLKAIDQPGADVGRAESQDPILRGYRVPAGEVEATVNRMQAEYPPRSGVRISADPRTNQVLVMAPPRVQQQIAAQLGAEPAAEEGPQRREYTVLPASQRSGGPQPAASVAIPHQLRHLKWNELEEGLQAILGERAQAAAAPGGQASHWRIQTAEGSEIGLAIDRERGEVTFRGAPAEVMAARRLITAMDQPRSTGLQQTRILPVKAAAASASQQATNVMRWASQFNQEPAGANNAAAAGLNNADNQQVERRIRWGGDVVARLFQQPDGNAAAQPQAGNQPQADPAGDNEPAAIGAPPAFAPDDLGAVLGSVRMEFIEGLDVIILIGNKRDVDRVAALISRIEELSKATQPVVDVHQLQHVGSEQMATVVSQVYDEMLSPRSGPVSILPLVKPNAILLVGRQESIDVVKEFIEKLDQETPPATEFAVIRLKHMAATSAQTIVTEFLSTQQQAAIGPGAAAGQGRLNLGTRAKVVADFRTNAVVVFAGPRDLAEVQKLLERLDVVDSETTNEVKVFKLKNSVAEELQPVLQNAILGSGGAAGAAPGIAPLPTAGGANQDPRSRQLTIDIMRIDAETGQELRSGILADVTISADPRSNALIVTAPSESMPLIEALIKELDALPTPEALIKVFTIVNGDATRLSAMLREMFGITQTGGFGGGGGGFGGGTPQVAQQTATGAGDSSLVAMRFGVDERSNSIIASGTAGDLEVVHAILLRLDEVATRKRKTTVYQLNNAPAQSVADAITQLLIDQRQIVQQTELQTSLVPPLEIIEREVIVVPEPISNSLLISATPQYYEQVLEVVQELDRRPPMVRIDVLIAEVMLDDFREVGFEFGLQDSLLFDRGIGAQTGGVNPVGFPFNNLPLGNNTTVNPSAVGTQGLSSFGLGRISPTAGFGGLVFSASSESVNVLVRALQERGKLQVLSRPQITTMDNIPGSVLVGQIVSRIRGTTINAATTTQDIEDINVGLLLDVTPRVAPDGLVTMAVNVQKSALDDDGVPIPTGDGGVVISPNINTTNAETTVSARSGQTIVFSGLITKSRLKNTRGIPVISDLPFIGPFFRFDTDSDLRTELLIIMTPTIIEDDQDIEWLKQTESERLNWCLADVIELYGDKGFRSMSQATWEQHQTPVIFPHEMPALEGWEGAVEVIPNPGELQLPTPAQPLQIAPQQPPRSSQWEGSSRNLQGGRSVLVPANAGSTGRLPAAELETGDGPSLAPANQVEPAAYYPPWPGN